MLQVDVASNYHPQSQHFPSVTQQLYKTSYCVQMLHEYTLRTILRAARRD